MSPVDAMMYYSDIAILNIKSADYRCISGISKSEAINLCKILI